MFYGTITALLGAWVPVNTSLVGWWEISSPQQDLRIPREDAESSPETCVMMAQPKCAGLDFFSPQDLLM